MTLTVTTKLSALKLPTVVEKDGVRYICDIDDDQRKETPWTMVGAEGRIRTDASLRILITNQAQSTTVPPRRQNRRSISYSAAFLV